LARIEQRPQALRPQVVVAAVPAEPAVVAHVDETRRVAVELVDTDAEFESVGETFGWYMAARARPRAIGGQPLVEEQALAERNCRGAARDAVAPIGRPRLRPRPMTQDPPDFVTRELCRWRVGGRRRHAGSCDDDSRPHNQRAPHHSSTMLRVARSVPLALRTSK